MSKRRKRTPVRRAVFTRLGRMLGHADAADSGLFLLFNHAVVGGADFVHLRIVQALADLRPTVLFTLPTDPQPLAPQFEALARCEYPGRRATGHGRRYFQIGRLATRINACPNPVLLGGNSRLYYELIPLLKPAARCIDLVHALGSVEHASLPVAHRLWRRVFIAAGVRDAVGAIYDQHGLDPALKQRMDLIENCVDVPQVPPAKADGPLRVLFVGRGAPEKRLHLVGRIATACRAQGVNARFTLVGDCEPAVDPADRAACEFTGMLADPAAVAPFYDSAHVLILTSSSEGFPLVVMEAMARGVVPVCTDVGGMPAHVIDDETGVLLPAREDAVVPAATQALAALAADRPRLARLAQAAHARALAHFGAERFVAQWQSLLQQAMATEGLDRAG